jgi:O-antigen/teichoic acid export membrane protein
VGLGLAAFAAPLIGLVFGPEWTEAAPLLSLFAVAFALRASTGLNWGALAVLADRTGYVAAVSAATAVFLVVVGLPLIWWLGPVGGAVYSLVQVLVMGPVVRLPLIRDVVGDLSFLRGTWRPLAVAGALALGAWLLGSPGLAPWTGLGAYAGFLAVSGGLLLGADPELRTAVAGLVRGGTA